LNVFASCGGPVGFPASAFPDPISEQPLYTGTMKINIYIQAHPNMSGLIKKYDSHYTAVLKTLMNSGDITWGLGTERSLYRFDVKKQGAKFYSEEFAYQLDKSQFGEINSIDFYKYDWYLQSAVINTDIYEKNKKELQQYPDQYITQTIREIKTMHSGEREVSVMVTNFEGHQDEEHEILSDISDYIQNERKAVGVFAFDNKGNPFYILVFGSIEEVSMFCETLNNTLENLNPVFGFYTIGLFITKPSRNSEVAKRDFDDQNDFAEWVRPAFDEEDIIPGDEKKGFDSMQGHHLYYSVWRNRLKDNKAQVMLNIKSIIPSLLKKRIIFREKLSLSIVTAKDKMSFDIPYGNTYAIFPGGNTMCFADDGLIPLDIQLDTSIKEISSGEVRALLIIRLYATFNDEKLFDKENFNECFRNTFNQLGTDIFRNKTENLAAEIYVHFIVR